MDGMDTAELPCNWPFGTLHTFPLLVRIVQRKRNGWMEDGTRISTHMLMAIWNREEAIAGKRMKEIQREISWHWHNIAQAVSKQADGIHITST